MKNAGHSRTADGRKLSGTSAQKVICEKPPYRNKNVLHHLKNEQEQRFYARDVAMLVATDAVVEAMKTAGISRSELAEKIERTQSHVSQVLSGSRNMTVGTLADLLWGCGMELRGLEVASLGESEVSHQQMDTHLDTGFRSIQVARVEHVPVLSVARDRMFRVVIRADNVSDRDFVGA